MKRQEPESTAAILMAKAKASGLAVTPEHVEPAIAGALHLQRAIETMNIYLARQSNEGET